ncbi:hypothetical protein [Peterkaempfera bronchialis]|nr:hypothetical protein [Peterkaempfera bronchialis]
MGSGDGQRMRSAFEDWLRAHGWKILATSCIHSCADIEAWHPDGARLLVEVQADTGADTLGPDLDTAYGRLLRRMDDVPSSRYAMVVPEGAVAAARQVTWRVRQLLRTDLYAVDRAGAVRRIEG